MQGVIPEGRRHWAQTIVVLSLLLATVATIVLASALGPIQTPPRAVLQVLAHVAGLPTGLPDPVQFHLIHTVRLPRVLLAALSGATLAVAGAVMQAVFRNPLAEPGITGVSAGAAAAAVVAIISGSAAALPWSLPIAAFLGAMGAVAIAQSVTALARGSAAMLLLVGIALNALLGAVISLAITNAPSAEDAQQAIFWLNGDMTAANWDDIRLATLPALAGMVPLLFFARELNLLLLGDDAAATTGVPTAVIRQILLALAALAVAATVAVTGIISFVGLVVPHLVRLTLGPDHRRLLPVSMAVGAIFLVLADLAARLTFEPVVLQTGVVTALVGSPILLALIIKQARQL